MRPLSTLLRLWPRGITPFPSHPEETQVLLRPEVGTQAQFKKKKEPRQYRYDSSLAPQLSWDGRNWAREAGEWLLRLIEEAAKLPAPHEFAERQVLKRPDGAEIVVRGLADAVRELKALSQPFLNWAGKAERLSFQVPSLPLFVEKKAAAERWVRAVNAEGSHGRWSYAMVGKIEDIPAVLEQSSAQPVA